MKTFSLILAWLVSISASFAAGKMFISIDGGAPVANGVPPKGGRFQQRHDNKIWFFSPTLGVHWQELTFSFTPSESEPLSFVIIQKRPSRGALLFDNIRVNGARLLNGDFEKASKQWKLSSSAQDTFIRDPNIAASGNICAKIGYNTIRQAFTVKKGVPVTIKLMVKGYSQVQVLIDTWNAFKRNLDMARELSKQTGIQLSNVEVSETIDAIARMFKSTKNSKSSANALTQKTEEIDHLFKELLKKELNMNTESPSDQLLSGKTFSKWLSLLDKAVFISRQLKYDLLFEYAFQT